MKITIIAGARPNFMKIAPIIRAIEKAQTEQCADITYRLVHTGQHYDERMSQTFFDELNIPKPHTNLECGGGTQAEQTAAIMVKFEKELKENPADLVLVVGDVTSTMACSIVAKKLCVKVAHVEAGIRSYDLSMPEEINRMVTDSIADYFFTTTQWATDNLLKLGVERERIFLVGNVMIDTLLANMQRFRKPAEYDELGLSPQNYFVLTMHRPANVDETDKLLYILTQILDNVNGLPVVFPIHPRTARMFQELGLKEDNLKIIPPLGYLEFNFLVQNSLGVITDSGGITEETTVMHIPCLTLRDNTERPETCEIGTNMLLGSMPTELEERLIQIIDGKWKKGEIPQYWDGQTAERIIKELQNLRL